MSYSLWPHGPVTYQAPLSMGFSRQEYWSGLPLPSPGDLPDPGTEPGSPALQADSLPSEISEKSQWVNNNDSLCSFQTRTDVHPILPFCSVSISEIDQSCLTLCDPTDCSPSGSPIHGIFQARILEWVAISFSRASSWPRDRTLVSRTAGRHFYRLSHQGSPLWIYAVLSLK